jgi:hypothetical protein
MKRLDILSGTGAGILGAALGLLFADWLKPFAVPALLIGIVVHGGAMYQKSRLEQQEGESLPGWAKTAELACWIMLAFLALFIGYRLY